MFGKHKDMVGLAAKLPVLPVSWKFIVRFEIMSFSDLNR